MTKGLSKPRPRTHVPLSSRPQVFISFSSADLETARAVAEGLTATGIRCFFAPRDIPAGANFAHEIVKAIATCDAMLLLLSPASIESPHVRREVALAIDEHRSILPFSLPGTDYPRGLTPEWTYWMSAVQVSRFDGVDRTVGLVATRLRQGPAGRRRRGAALAVRAPDLSSEDVRRTPLRLRRTPSALLRAEFDEVPLIGRDEELLRLELWANRDDDFDARLVIAGAGQGKTRLAREFGARLASAGWEHHIVAPSVSGLSVAQTLPAKPALIVIDYAETRVQQVSDLLEGIMELGLPNRVRLLLLARSAADWWKRLKSSSAVVDGLLDGVTVQPLRKITEDQATVQQLYQAARASFATALGKERQNKNSTLYRHFPSVLDILEAALADVLTGTSETKTSVTSRLLSHERRYIQNAAAAEGIQGFNGIDLDRCTVLVTVFGADDEDMAVALLACAYPDASQAKLRKLARLFHWLYPGTDMYVDGLRPDALAGDLIAELVTEDGALPGGAAAWDLVRGQPAQLRRSITVLTHAAATRKVVRPQLQAVIAPSDTEVLIAAIDVASQVEDASVLVAQIGEALRGAVDVDARRLLDAVPSETVNLAELAAILADRVFHSLPDAERRGIAYIETILACSNRFSDAGWADRAVQTVQAAVQSLEQLLEVEPGARRLLARALSNLSNRYWEIGRLERSVAPALRSVQEFERVSQSPDAARPSDAVLLDAVAASNNLAFRLAEQGDFDEAYAHARTAEAGYRIAAEQGIRLARAGLGSALNNLSCISLALGAHEDALRYGLEAVTLRRSQASLDRDRYLPYVARTLANAASAVMATGDEATGLAMIAEARSLHAITGSRAPIFRFEEAESATIDGVLSAIAGQAERARTALTEALALLEGISGGLGELTARATEAVAHNLRRLDALPRPGWGEVTSIGRRAWLGDPDAPFALPQLLEYKDL